jgi:hypothetical protein
MIRERRVSPGEVQRYVSDMGREISDLEQRLATLRAAHAGSGAAAAAAPVRRRRGRPPRSASVAPAAAPVAAAPPVETAKPRRGRRRRTAITAEQLASRQLQGRYLALIRQIPATRRGQYTKIAKDKGREAAIREMRVVLNK